MEKFVELCDGEDINILELYQLGFETLNQFRDRETSKSSLMEGERDIFATTKEAQTIPEYNDYILGKWTSYFDDTPCPNVSPLEQINLVENQAEAETAATGIVDIGRNTQWHVGDGFQFAYVNLLFGLADEYGIHISDMTKLDSSLDERIGFLKDEILKRTDYPWDEKSISDLCDDIVYFQNLLYKTPALLQLRYLILKQFKGADFRRTPERRESVSKSTEILDEFIKSKTEMNIEAQSQFVIHNWKIIFYSIADSFQAIHMTQNDVWESTQKFDEEYRFLVDQLNEQYDLKMGIGVGDDDLIYGLEKKYKKIQEDKTSLIKGSDARNLIWDILYYMHDIDSYSDEQLKFLVVKYLCKHVNEPIDSNEISKNINEKNPKWYRLNMQMAQKDLKAAIDSVLFEIKICDIFRPVWQGLDLTMFLWIGSFYNVFREGNINKNVLSSYIYKEEEKWEIEHPDKVNEVKKHYEGKFKNGNLPSFYTDEQKEAINKKRKEVFVQDRYKKDIYPLFLFDFVGNEIAGELECDLGKISIDTFVNKLWKYIEANRFIVINNLLQYCPDIQRWRPLKNISLYYTFLANTLDTSFSANEFNGCFQCIDNKEIEEAQESNQDIDPLEVYTQPVGLIHEGSDSTKLYAVRVQTMETHEETVRFLLKNIYGTQLLPTAVAMDVKTNMTQLKRLGINVTAQNLPDIVKSLNDNYEKIPLFYAIERLGWYDKESFVAANLIGGKGKTYPLFDQTSLLSNGTLAEWREIAREATKERILPQIVLCAGFASVIVGALHNKCLLINLCGKPGIGKTTFEGLVNSIWSKPFDRKIYTTFDGTDYALVSKLNENYGISFVLDDTSKGDQKNYSRLIYQLYDGTSRDRLGKDHQLEESKYWSTSIFLSSENSIFQKCFVEESGVLRRLIEFEVNKGDLTIDGEQAKKIDKGISRNYGYAGLELVNYIFRNGLQYDIEELYQNQLASVRQYIQNRQSELQIDLSVWGGAIDTLASQIAVLLVTADLVKQSIALDFDQIVSPNLIPAEGSCEIVEKILNVFNNARQILEESDSDVVPTDAINELYEHIRNVGKKTHWKIHSNNPNEKDKSAVYQGVHEGTDYYHIPHGEIDAFISEYNKKPANSPLDKRELLQRLNDLGLLKTLKNRLENAITVDRKTYKVISIKKDDNTKK